MTANAIHRLCKAALLALSVLCFKAGANAQGIYEIKYRFYEKNAAGDKVLSPQEYTSLVFFIDATNPSNVMRTRYYDATDGWVVVEQKIKINTSADGAKTQYVLDGVTPTFVSTVSKGAKYNPDHIVLTKSNTDNTYRPGYVYDDGRNTGSITSFKTLDRPAVTNDYLDQYKWTWNKKTPSVNKNVDLSASTLHLILVTNSDDEKLGEGFLTNHQNMARLFTDAAKTCNLKMNLVEVKGTSFSKQKVLSALEALSPSENDIVVFYYSGHGFRYSSQTAQWPQLDLRPNGINDITNNTLNLDKDIYKTLSLKNPRLLMVIGECCNVDAGIGTPSVPSPLTLGLGSPVMNESTVRNLFSTRGKMIVASSKPYESSWYYTESGGFFGTNFTSTFLSNVGFTSAKTPANWQAIIKKAIDNTVLQTEGGQGGTKPQHPIFRAE